MSIIRNLTCIAVLLTAWNAPAGCQAGVQPVGDSADVLVVDHDFSGPNDFVRLFLQGGQVYRAELSSPDVTLEIRGVVRTTQAPHVYRFLTSQTPSGTTLLEIYPEKDAEYEIRARAIGGSRLPMRLRLYRDVVASARRHRVRAGRGWDVGVELAGGWHSGFAQSGGVPVTGSTPEGGMDVEGCFTARGVALSGRFSMCALGVGHQSQHGSRSILWIYTEPRFRLLGSARPDRSGWELGPLFRFGVGMISASPNTPVIIAPGAYIARFTRSSRGGWSLQASYSRPSYKGFRRPFGTDPATPKGHRVSIGLGWYR